MTRDPREEAERLVATALAALQVAAGSTAGFATGSAECCVCPVCKAIAAARDPDPEFAERLASGVGDLAVGLAGVLRAFGTREDPAQSRTPEPETTQDVWQGATKETPMSPKPMAKKAVKPKIDPEA